MARTPFCLQRDRWKEWQMDGQVQTNIPPTIMLCGIKSGQQVNLWRPPCWEHQKKLPVVGSLCRNRPSQPRPSIGLDIAYTMVCVLEWNECPSCHWIWIAFSWYWWVCRIWSRLLSLCKKRPPHSRTWCIQLETWSGAAQRSSHGTPV